MLRALPWLIVGGITLAATIVVVQLSATFFYLRSPERVVKGAFTRLIDAKSVHINLLAEEEGANGTSFKVDGGLDKQMLLMPVGALSFSFQTAGQAFYGNGEAKLKDGQLYLRFAQIAGLPDVLPGALQTIWAGVNVSSLLLSGTSTILPVSTGSFTESDVQSFSALLKQHIPVRPDGKGTSEKLDGVPVLHYPVAFDRQQALEFIIAVRELATGEVLTDAKRKDIEISVQKTPPLVGEVWVAKKDGTLRALRVVITRAGMAPLHITVLLSRYNEPVTAETPLEVRSLYDLLGRLFGPSLTGAARTLPFVFPTIPKPGEPALTTTETEKRGERDTDKDGLSDVSELFYGTNPFNEDSDNDGTDDGAEVARGSNPRGLGNLFEFGIR